jgi:ABC-type oligopeptide transport system substrate-binding subunit
MIPRRTFLAGGPLALSACRAADGAYFGKTDPPDRQRLVAVLGVEPGSLDPATSAELIEDRVIYALFEGLTTLHPQTGEAMAGLATHYELDPDGLRYTFYLRGHPEPQGKRLGNRDDLPLEYSRALRATPDAKPAKWSDGVRITAHDFVYSWRRSIDPATPCVYAYLMHCIVNAKEITAGKLSPDRLAIRAIDDSTLQVLLSTAVSFFLELIATKYFCAVPQRVIEAAGDAWTLPDHIVTSGAFILRERRSREKIALTRNPYYYDASKVSLDELVFLPVVDSAAGITLYRTAEAAISSITTPTLAPVLQRKRDFRPTRVFGVMWANLKTAQPPFTDVRVRHALNMAIDKGAIADMVPGQAPAVGLIPPMNGYEPLQRVTVPFGSSELNALEFNPRAARELLESAIGRRQLRIQYTHPPFPNFKLAALILQQQWRHALGIELDLIQKDVATWGQATFDKTYPDIVANGDASPYIDPSYLLEHFTSAGASSRDWSDPTYDAMIEDAARTAEREHRLQKLAQCERRLLSAMPMLPLSTFVFPYLAKPYVKGLGTNLLDRQEFKYVWIDTNWRPQ